MDINDVLANVAEMNGVTLDEVKDEMQKSIHEAAIHPSPEFKAFFGDREPNIEEFLSKMSSKAMKKMLIEDLKV